MSQFVEWIAEKFRPQKDGFVKETSAKDVLYKYGIVIVFVLMCAVLSILTDTFLTQRNLLNVIRQVSIIGIISVGMMIVILTGGIDLSVGSIVAFSGVAATSFAHPDTYPIIVPVLVGILAGTLLGAVNGFIVSKVKVAPFIATLGMLSVAKGLALVICNGRPVINLTETFKFIGGGYLLGIPVPILLLILVFIIGFILLNKTKYGRYIYAIGGNENAARVSGLNVAKFKFYAYVISGTLAGLAGMVLASRINAGQPNSGSGYELDAVASVVIGGTSLTGGLGSIFGTLLGVLIIGVVNNGLDLLNVSSYYQLIAKGVIIVLAVAMDKKSRK